MSIYGFMNFLEGLEGLDYTIEFNLVDDGGGSTFEIRNINDFGEILKEQISRWKLDEYGISILRVEAKPYERG